MELKRHGILLLIALLGISACTKTGLGVTTCVNDADCTAGGLCVDGQCQPTGENGLQQVACSSDAQCQAIDSRLVCSAVGLCSPPEGGGPCNVTTDCPPDQFCNTQSQICVPLQAGYCREESQCDGLKCFQVGGVGRCVECTSGADCASGECLSNGTCAEASACDPACGPGQRCSMGQCVDVASSCNPPCVAGEQCVQGVCYGSNGCPRHAHPVSGQCVCDDGYTANPNGTGCVPLDAEGNPTCDPVSATSCQQSGGVWDAVACRCLAGGTCSPACGPGTACQNGTCVAVGPACESDWDCMQTMTDFFACDQTSASCVCDAMFGQIICGLNDMDFDPSTCDCDWSSLETPDAGSPDRAPTPDAGTPDSARPDRTRPDRAEPDSAPPDAGVSTDAGGDDAGADAGGEIPGEDVCAERGWYGDGECDSVCLRRDPDCYDGETGAPCSRDYQCTASYDAICDTDWPDGFCYSTCTRHSDCGVNAFCVCVQEGWFGCSRAECNAACDSDADCRPGYACTSFSDDYSFCLPEY